MDRSLYRYILKLSARKQLLLLALVLLSMPIVYITLELPKLIVNQAIGGEGVPDTLFGYQMDQIRYLIVLCVAFLTAVTVAGLVKYVINVVRGVIGEQVLRQFRATLYEHVLRFPLPMFKRVSQGEIIPMITAETEPLGEFIGESYSLPIQQGGLLLTYLVFIFMQNFWMGLAAVSLYPFQMWIIPRLQMAVNRLAKKRVRKMREISAEVGETVSGIGEIHGNDTSRRERAYFSKSLTDIYNLRFDIYKRKFFIKFLNNFLAQLTPFFFYLAGGYFVIVGELSLGALIAVLAANKDLAGPWKELLRYYQRREDIRVKYLQIIEQFNPETLLDVELLDHEASAAVGFTGQLQLRNVSYAEAESSGGIKRLNTKIDLDKHIQILGDNNSGKSDLAGLIARFYHPTSGSILLNGSATSTLPQAVTGRKIAYAGQVSYLFSGSIFDNIVYGLQHTLKDEASDDWNDYTMAGVDDLEGLKEKVIDLIDELGFSTDLFRFGMSSRLKRNSNVSIITDIKRARQAMARKIDSGELSRLVEPFNSDEYNVNMSVAENLLFGNLKHKSYSVKNLYELPLMKKVLKETGLDEDFSRIGLQLAELMVELFADVEPGSELFDQFSFVGPDELADLQKLLTRLEQGRGKKGITKSERSIIDSLPFQLIVSRHRLGLVNDVLQKKIVHARKSLSSKLEQAEIDYIPFTADEYQPSLSVQENILFGKVVYGQAYAEEKVMDAIDETVSDIGIFRKIVATGLDYEVGVGGARLSAALRQGIVLCRCLLKQPDLLIINEATNALDEAAENRVIEILREKQKGKAFVLVSGNNHRDETFDQHICLSEGRLIEA
jgi:ABC-type bacteriocin/lantibiotic exporter with double-glycine peptidase domain